MKFENYANAAKVKKAFAHGKKEPHGVRCYENADDDYIIGTAYIAFKVNPIEYTALFFPLFGDAGDWTFRDGKKIPECDKIFDRFFCDNEKEAEIHKMDAIFNDRLCACYSKEKDFVSFVNADYIGAVTASKYKSESPKSAIKCYDKNGNMFAVIMPCLGNARIENAVRAYFS